MRTVALAFSSALLVVAVSGTASAVPAFYNEVIQDLGAQGCQPSTEATVPGCTNLCHTSDPNQTTDWPPKYEQPFCATLMAPPFSWSGYSGLSGSTLDAPLTLLKQNAAYAAAVAVVEDACANPEAELPVIAPSLIPPVEYGCAVGTIGSAGLVAKGIPMLLVGLLGFAAAFAARRPRR